MTPDQLTRVRDLAVKQGLRHLAMDAQAAIDGCPHSLEAVDEWLSDNHLFEMEAIYRAMPSARAATPSGLSRFASSAKLASLSQERAA